MILRPDRTKKQSERIDFFGVLILNSYFELQFFCVLFDLIWFFLGEKEKEE